MVFRNEIMYGVFFVLCFLGTQGKPSLSFNLPNFAALAGFGTSREQRDTGLKQYSGKRITNDSLRMVYFFDQTVAVVELGPKKLLLNCELLEVYEPEEALKSLGELQKVSRPVAISFGEMMQLMSQCQQVDSYRHPRPRASPVSNPGMARGLLTNNPLTLLSGIIPGTKWCGTGDIAKDYHDLGSEASVDRCCRTHDLCPIKVRAYTNRYNLTNNSLYTKSHCKCDDELYTCLKGSDSPTAHIMGNVYFNLIQVPCVDEAMSGRRFRGARNNF